MLTNAQSWRRLKSSRGAQRRKHETEYFNECNAKASTQLRREESKILTQNPTIPTVDQISSTASSPSGRRVKFSSVIRVCLVPCRSDFQSDFHALFWMREDYQQFKEDAVRELRAHWLTNRTTVKEAIIDLYQPNAADYAASKTFLSHVDSMAHLRLAAMERASSEDLFKLSSLCAPVVDLNAPNANDLLSGADQSLGTLMPRSTSSEASEDSSGSSAAEPWSPSSADTAAAQMGDTAAAQMGDAAVAVTPLCLGTPDSTSTLLGQVTAPHIDPITPMKTESASDEADPAQAATPTKTVLHTKPATNSQNLLSSSMQFSGCSNSSTPLSILTAPVSRGERDGSSSSTNSSKPAEGLRIILVEDSPASSISSFETPIMIYGQS